MAKIALTYPSFHQPSHVTFGTGSVRTLAQCDSLDATAFFLSGKTAVRTVVKANLEKVGGRLDTARVLAKPDGEPTTGMVQMGAEFLKQRPFMRIVGIGGGSVLDWCRLAWAHSQDALCFESGQVNAQLGRSRRPELWLVPTTCGTGAEAAGVAVFSREGQKIPAVSRLFLADRVLLDGQFLDHVDPGHLACSFADALSHGIEAFLSIVPSRLAKEAAIAGLGLVLQHAGLRPSPSRNERLMEGGYLGGVAASNCSVGVVHAFAHTIASYGVGHGRANALGLIAGIRANAEVPAMQELLCRCGVATPEELIERVKPVVNRATTEEARTTVLGALRDRASREVICQRMSTDVCLRSNPKRMTRSDLGAFLDTVIETAATA